MGRLGNRLDQLLHHHMLNNYIIEEIVRFMELKINVKINDIQIILAKGFNPISSAFDLVVSIKALAPSLSFDELAAVTVPSIDINSSIYNRSNKCIVTKYVNYIPSF
jgi:hypothetical protein